MSSEKAIFDIFKSLFDADTGSGGLQNTNSLNAARVVGPFTRRGDPQDTFALPRIECEVFDREADTTGMSRVEALVRLYVFTDANLSYGGAQGSQNGVASRVRTVFHRVTPSASNGWNPSIIRRVRSFQGPQSNGVNQQVHEFQLFLQRSSHA
jgi:hypothetical protein